MVVEVRDRNNAPVAGASVVFLLPQTGASGTFATGGKMMTVVTNASGRATSGVFQPIGTGQLKIQVTASFQGHSASTAIAQTNQLGAAAGMSRQTSTLPLAVRSFPTPGSSSWTSLPWGWPR